MVSQEVGSLGPGSLFLTSSILCAYFFLFDMEDYAFATYTHKPEQITPIVKSSL